jgi:hypothetical protein
MTTLEALIADRNDWTPERKDAAREYYNRIALSHALDCLRVGHTAAAMKFLSLAAGTVELRSRLLQATMLARLPGPLRELAFRIWDVLNDRAARASK